MTVAGIWARKARAEHGRRLNERGKRSEAMVAKALSRRTRPAWIAEVKTTRRLGKLDVAGVDVLVRLTDGRSLFLQVKSSEAGARKFLEKRRADAIGLVVVLRDDDLNTVYGKALAAILGLVDLQLAPHRVRLAAGRCSCGVVTEFDVEGPCGVDPAEIEAACGSCGTRVILAWSRSER